MNKTKIFIKLIALLFLSDIAKTCNDLRIRKLNEYEAILHASGIEPVTLKDCLMDREHLYSKS